MAQVKCDRLATLAGHKLKRTGRSTAPGPGLVRHGRKHFLEQGTLANRIRADMTLLIRGRVKHAVQRFLGDEGVHILGLEIHGIFAAK